LFIPFVKSRKKRGFWLKIPSENIVKVSKASKARKLAFSFSSRRHGRRRRQKARAATKVCKARTHKNLFLYLRAVVTDVIDVKTFYVLALPSRVNRNKTPKNFSLITFIFTKRDVCQIFVQIF
jgi:hypothetical protein